MIGDRIVTPEKESGHFADFSRGVFSLVDVVFYLSVTIVFLLLTIVILESRRWR